MLVDISICEVIDNAAGASAGESSNCEEADSVEAGKKGGRAESEAPVARQQEQVSANRSLHASQPDVRVDSVPEGRRRLLLLLICRKEVLLTWRQNISARHTAPSLPFCGL